MSGVEEVGSRQLAEEGMRDEGRRREA